MVRTWIHLFLEEIIVLGIFICTMFFFKFTKSDINKELGLLYPSIYINNYIIILEQEFRELRGPDTWLPVSSCVCVGLCDCAAGMTEGRKGSKSSCSKKMNLFDIIIRGGGLQKWVCLIDA